MALGNDQFLETKGFILSPFINRWKIGRYSELGQAGLKLDDKRLIGFMTKIADSNVGRVLPDGTVSKPVTASDR